MRGPWFALLAVAAVVLLAGVGARGERKGVIQPTNDNSDNSGNDKNRGVPAPLGADECGKVRDKVMAELLKRHSALNPKLEADASVSTGVAGVSLSFLLAFLSQRTVAFREMAADYVRVEEVKTDDETTQSSTLSGPGFLLGSSGPPAVCAAVMYQSGKGSDDDASDCGSSLTADMYLAMLGEGEDDVADNSVLEGRAGWLYAAQFVNELVGAGSVPDAKIEVVLQRILASGRGKAEGRLDWTGGEGGTLPYELGHGNLGTALFMLRHAPLLSAGDRGELLATALHAAESFLNDTARVRAEDAVEDSPDAAPVPLSAKDKASRKVVEEFLAAGGPLAGPGGVVIALGEIADAAAAAAVDSKTRDVLHRAAMKAAHVVHRRVKRPGALDDELDGLGDGLAGDAYAMLAAHRHARTEDRKAVYLDAARRFAAELVRRANKGDRDKNVNKASYLFGEAGFALLFDDLATDNDDDLDSARLVGIELPVVKE